VKNGEEDSIYTCCAERKSEYGAACLGCVVTWASVREMGVQRPEERIEGGTRTTASRD
jgi:hypothetical protein